MSSFEQTVLSRLDDISTRLASLEKRSAEHDLERIVRDIQDMHQTFKVYFKNFDRKLDVINSEFLQLKADQRLIEDRVGQLEVETRPQVVVPDREF